MMERRHARLRDALTACALIAMLFPASAAAVVPAGCGATTLEATIAPAEDGILTCAPGESIKVRDDIVTPDAARASMRAALTSFVALADPGIVDEESPLRAEFLDKCGTLGADDAFRPHESLIPALLEGHVRAIGRLASDPAGSPNVHKPYDFAVGLGSMTDNRQRNELRWAIDLLDGTGLLDPDSGADGYEGVQGADPDGAGDLVTPVPGTSIRELANEPFVAAGLRAGSAPLPWYDVIGDRDAKLWGRAPANATIDEIATAWATGAIKLSDLGPQHVARICQDPSLLTDASFLTRLAGEPGVARAVTADAARAPLDRDAWIEEHRSTVGIPAGHGYAARCTGEGGAPLARACYAWTQNLIRFIALDTTPASGIGGANIDAAQFAWLERELRANSSTYFTADGDRKTLKNNDRAIVILQHHPTSGLAANQDGGAHGGADLRRLLLRYPNVILQMSANAARHRITPREDEEAGTGYWEVETAAIADWPSQSRSIEIADNGDGTISIFSVMVDAALPPDPRTIRWANDDPTDERARGADRRINEAWLGSAAREVAYWDPQAPSAPAGAAVDRNVELVVRSPFPRRQPVNPPLPPITGLPTTPTFPTVPSFPTFQPPQLPNFGGTPFTPPTGFPAAPSFQPPPTITGPGLAVLPSARGGWGGQALRLFGIAAVGGWWLWRARVRRWMVGI